MVNLPGVFNWPNTTLSTLVHFPGNVFFTVIECNFLWFTQCHFYVKTQQFDIVIDTANRHVDTEIFPLQINRFEGEFTCLLNAKSHALPTENLPVFWCDSS
jgi:hypothetical protein